VSKEAIEVQLITHFSFPPSQVHNSAANGQWRNKWFEFSSLLKQKQQTETITQPFVQRFSSVGILSCIRRQREKEWDGGIQLFQMISAQGKVGAADRIKETACFEVSLPSAE